MRGICGVFLVVIAVILGGAARAEPPPVGGTASYRGEKGDLIFLKIDLDDGHHIEILRDPMMLIGRQMASGVSDVIPSDNGPPESVKLDYCKSSSKDCEPFDGHLIIESLSDHAVKGYVTMPGYINDGHPFVAHLTHYQNPLLTGGLFYHSKPQVSM